MTERLSALRAYMKQEGIDAFIVPSNDAFQSEYVPEHAQCLKWLTGFTGSNGLAIILQRNKAAFFTDGRYTLQAKTQVPEAFERFNLADKKPYEWLMEVAEHQDIGFDPWLHTEQNIVQYQKVGCSMKAVHVNPVHKVWSDRQKAEGKPIVIHPLQYAGQKSEEKCKNLASEIVKKKADWVLITAPDSICWLLNIRGNDVPCSPLALSYAFVDKKGGVDIFLESATWSGDVTNALGKNVRLHQLDDLVPFVKDLKKSTVLYDNTNAPYWFVRTLKRQHTLIATPDPCQLPKSIKNKVEIEGAKAAHIRDGKALTKGIEWIKARVNAGASLTEVDVADKLLELRARQDLFQEASFGTIAGFNADGAIVHYQAQKETTATLDSNDGSMLLVDSGGQYLDGTTDITRTIALGKPTAEQKHMFTLVLKGHIALATAIFPKGTTGSALDILARQYLWQEHKDFDHGTGHGVGSYLGVHEGPQRISKFPNYVALRPGMIISNEPGYYKTGEYGIRIESLIVVVESGTEGFYTFETISKAPIDMGLVEDAFLTEQEHAWLKNYHRDVN